MRGLKAGAVLVGGLLLAGCGSDEAIVEPMAEAAAESAPAAVGNQPPVIEEIAFEPRSPRPGERVTARVVARDPEGDPITLEYTWSAGGSPVEGSRPWIQVGNLQRNAAVTVTVVAKDAHGSSAPESASARIGNTPPTLSKVVLVPETGVHAGTDIEASPRAVDPEGDVLEYSYRWSVNGSTLPIEGPTLPASSFERGDVIVLEVVASDGSDETEPLASEPIRVGNAPPRITSKAGAIGDDGVFRYAVQVEDPDGDRAFRYRLLAGPEGMAIGFDDGEVRWEPPAGSAGSHPIEIEVEDLFGGRTTQSFALQLAFETEEQASAPAQKREEAAPPAAPAADAESDAEESGRSLFDDSPFEDSLAGSEDADEEASEDSDS